MSNFFGAVRVEAQIIDFACFALFIGMACLGGIPNPHVSKFLWQLWMAMIVLQWLVMASSLLMVPLAFFSLRRQYWGCMTEVSNGDKMLDVVAVITFPFQPVCLAKQGVMLCYIVVGALGGYVYQATTNVDMAWLTTKLYDKYWDAVVCFIFIFALFWFGSLSWTLGLVFFLPLALFMAAGVGLICFVGRFTADKLHKLELEGRSKIARVAVESLQAMLFAMHIYVDEQEQHTSLGTTLYLFAALMILSPLVVYSTLAMTFVYAGNPTHAVMDLVADIYQHAFAVFRGARFQLPTFDLDLSDAFGALSSSADLTLFASFDPSYFLKSSLALTALNFFISLIKPLIGAGCSVLSAFGLTATQVANLPIAAVTAAVADGKTANEKLLLYIAKAESEQVKEAAAAKESFKKTETSVSSVNLEEESAGKVNPRHTSRRDVCDLEEEEVSEQGKGAAAAKESFKKIETSADIVILKDESAGKDRMCFAGLCG